MSNSGFALLNKLFLNATEVTIIINESGEIILAN